MVVGEDGTLGVVACSLVVPIAGGSPTDTDDFLAFEFHLAVSPVFFGGGQSLFDRLDLSALGIELTRTVGSPKVSHLFYSVKK